MLRYKMTFACLMIVLYIMFSYYHSGGTVRGQRKTLSSRIYRILLNSSILYFILDFATVYTVNHLDTVNPILNAGLHLCFLLYIDFQIFLIYLYMLALTDSFPKEKRKRIYTFLPFFLNIVVGVMSIGDLEYRIGAVTNYSMGIPAYTCYIMVVVYTILAILTFVRHWNYIKPNKRDCITFSLIVLALIMIVQMIFPELLLSALAITVVDLCIYVTMENRAVMALEDMHAKTVLAFADVIESRDGSTGEHVKRTTEYVRLIVEKLKEKGIYREILTKDYVENLLLAAPMHDIGKIAVPDAILQKPGKLDEEEFQKMKEHTTRGKEIIEETLSRVEEEQYVRIARDVAWCHHEKWDGSGYPCGLSGADIPLCARIMAVADVFDAVSEKRCYREAMPMDQAFTIIEEGRDGHFEGVIVDAFMEMRPEIEKVHDAMRGKETT